MGVIIFLYWRLKYFVEDKYVTVPRDLDLSMRSTEEREP